jgi:hypothetical protein
MPFRKQYDLPEPLTQPPCVFLRSKRLYVQGDFISPEEAEHERHFWCSKTQHVIGPDSQCVDRTSCVAGRACYRLTRNG